MRLAFPHTSVIGLGSNLNRPLQQLRQAFQALLKQTDLHIEKASAIYQSPPLLPPDADASWKHKPYLNAALLIHTSLPPLELLQRLKKIEQDLGRNAHQKWAPRPIDLDILCYDQLHLKNEILTLPHPELLNRSFALRPLLEVFPLYQQGQENLIQEALAALPPLTRLPHLLAGPQMVGILNITPDSFSDGGQFMQTEAALAQAESLFEKGADIIDIGAESTRPLATLLNVETEWLRLEPILQAIHAKFKNQEHRPLISIDTRHALIIERALAYEIDWINDVSQAEFESMRPFLTSGHLKYVAMHHLSIPADPSQILSEDPLIALKHFQETWQKRFDAAQCLPSQLILDPGLGFGKTPDQQWEIIRRFSSLPKTNTTWMVGHSRKSFLKKSVPDLNSLDLASALISSHLAHSGAHYLRIHDPEASLSTIKIQNILNGSDSHTPI